MEKKSKKKNGLGFGKIRPESGPLGLTEDD